MASLRKIHSLICLVQDSELWHISLWNKRHFSCLSGEWRAARDKREESARGETFTRGRASKKNKKTSTHAVSPRASSSARLKSQINLAPVSQDRENSTIRVLAIFKCFLFTMFKLRNPQKLEQSFSCSHFSLHRQIYKPSFNRAHCFQPIKTHVKEIFFLPHGMTLVI